VTEACVGLGSNLGDRAAHLDAAIAGLGTIGTVEAVSSVYETAPSGGPPRAPTLALYPIRSCPRNDRA